MEFLTLFAEISIAILAFTSIVAQFISQNDPNWNKHLFQGMVSHCIMAFVFSCLPFLLNPLVTDIKIVWLISCWLIGLITFSQGIAVMLVDKISNNKTKTIMLIISSAVFFLQLLNIFEIFWKTNEGPYLIGIFWHIMQSLNIFMIFIFTKKEQAIRKSESEFTEF
jgi:hypothetical protein